MQQEDFWVKFLSSGSIEEYLKYKNSDIIGETDADNDNGACTPCDKNRGSGQDTVDTDG